MIKQMNLENMPASPYEGVCCKACWYAKGEKCVCKCDGQHHGKGNPTKDSQTVKRNVDENPFKNFYPSAQKYHSLLDHPTCRNGHNLSEEIIWAYPHHDGWEIEETDELQWLYITCSQCKIKNDIVLWKLGLTREANIEDLKKNE